MCVSNYISNVCSHEIYPPCAVLDVHVIIVRFNCSVDNPSLNNRLSDYVSGISFYIYTDVKKKRYNEKSDIT